MTVPRPALTDGDARARRLRAAADIPLPDKDGARALLDINLRGVKVADDVDRDALAGRLAGYSGADITNVSGRVSAHTCGCADLRSRRRGLCVCVCVCVGGRAG